MALLLINITVLQCSADTSQDLTLDIAFYGPRWDINHDGKTDILDASLFVSNYGEEGTPDWIRSDININGQVDPSDASYVAGHYGEQWIVP